MQDAPSLLVVDDAILDRMRWTLLGRRHGFDVETADTAQEAMRSLQRRRPDAVLMDLDMPGTDGVSATRILRQDPDLHDLVVLCHSGSHHIQAAVETGLFDGDLPKDLPDDVLVESALRFAGRRVSLLA